MPMRMCVCVCVFCHLHSNFEIRCQTAGFVTTVLHLRNRPLIKVCLQGMNSSSIFITFFRLLKLDVWIFPRKRQKAQSFIQIPLTVFTHYCATRSLWKQLFICLSFVSWHFSYKKKWRIQYWNRKKDILYSLGIQRGVTSTWRKT